MISFYKDCTTELSFPATQNTDIYFRGAKWETMKLQSHRNMSFLTQPVV